jgi:hypothetical protein
MESHFQVPSSRQGEGQEGGTERRSQDCGSLATPILAFPLDRGEGTGRRTPYLGVFSL